MVKKAKAKAKPKAKAKASSEGGVLFRGATGELYFINNTELQKYQLSPEDQRKMESSLRSAFTACIQAAGVSASDTVSASDGVLPLP